MELVNEFTVNRPIDEAWTIITNVELIAPCLPGAQLQEIEGDVYRGVVKVKVGPISAALKGEAKFLERDDINHKAVLKGDGRDTKGNGNASALITASLEELTPTSAKCVVHTDLNMTGKVAQFGRGALADISGKLMKQFADNLDEMLAKGGDAVTNGSAAAASTAPTSAATAADTAADTGTDTTTDAAAGGGLSTETSGASTGATAATSASSGGGAAGTDEAPVQTTPTVRTINGPAAEPIDAFSLGGSAILKRLVPIFGGLVILLFALRRRNK
jgi:carbon monoxide dehydrogenase subunit G